MIDPASKFAAALARRAALRAAGCTFELTDRQRRAADHAANRRMIAAINRVGAQAVIDAEHARFGTGPR